MPCRGWWRHPHWEGAHCSLNGFNDLLSYCLLPLEGSRRIDLIVKHFLVPRGQFSYLTLLVIRYRLEMLDEIKHLPSVLSTFLELGEEPFMFLDRNSEH